jgi:Protein of unknown function (DUF3037)
MEKMSRSFSYSILTYVVDELTQTSVPVGVVLWAEATKETRIRIAESNERIKGLKPSSLPFLQLAKGKIEGWLSQPNRLSYAPAGLIGGSDAWWRHVSKLLVHSIRLSEPRAIDCIDPDKEVELLYEAVVGPVRKRGERHERIDWELVRTLGPLANRLDKGEVVGFKGHPVSVKRFKEDSNHILVIEGVNLATSAAEQDADALVSRLLRIQERDGKTKSKKVMTLVGYLTSPNGLNGEAFLVEWIREKAQAQTFDLLRQGDGFCAAVEGQLSHIQPTEKQKRLEH